MGKRRSRPFGSRSIKVTCYDPEAHKSVSFTVYPGTDSVEDVAYRAHQELDSHYRITNLNDRRHKRRF